jgi:hypothetical protein
MRNYYEEKRSLQSALSELSTNVIVTILTTKIGPTQKFCANFQFSVPYHSINAYEATVHQLSGLKIIGGIHTKASFHKGRR